MKTLFPLVIILFVFQISLFGQSKNIYTSNYTNALNGPGYLSPLTNTVSANLTTQIFPSLYTEKLGFSLGIVGVQAKISNTQRTHTGMTEGLSSNQMLEVPTIFGDSQPIFVEDGSGNLYSFPGGFEVNTISFLIPQITITGLANTDLTFRFFAYDFEGRWGELALLGGGVRHHLHPYFSLPEDIKIGIGYAYNKLTADNEIVETQVHYGFLESMYMLSNNFSFYATVGYRQSELTIDYNEGQATTLFSGDGDQKMRFGAGISMEYKPVLIRAGLEVMNPVTFSAYAGISF